MEHVPQDVRTGQDQRATEAQTDGSEVRLKLTIKYDLPREDRYRHRGTWCSALVKGGGEYGSIDGICIVIVQLVDRTGWWIVPDSKDDEAKFTDRGPFDTPEAAIAYLRLVS
jgi:hypothetical protein